MPSFLKDDPIFKFSTITKTSVLADEACEWPFSTWDFNALFCHDFPLLKLPQTVLLDVLKMVENWDRRELSFSCSLFRALIIKNKTIEMDRRREEEIIISNSRIGISIGFVDWGYRHVVQLSTLEQYQNYMQSKRLSFYFPMVTVEVDDNEFPIIPIVQALVGLTDEVSIEWTYEYDGDDPEDAFMQKCVDAFVAYPHVQSISLMTSRPANWTVYCTKVHTWSRQMGVRVVLRSDSMFGFAKINNGQTLIVSRNI